MTPDVMLIIVIAVFVCAIAALTYIVHRQWRMISDMQNRLMSRSYSEFASFVQAGKREERVESVPGESMQDPDDRLDELSGRVVRDVTRELPEIKEYLGVSD